MWSLLAALLAGKVHPAARDASELNCSVCQRSDETRDAMVAAFKTGRTEQLEKRVV